MSYRNPRVSFCFFPPLECEERARERDATAASYSTCRLTEWLTDWLVFTHSQHTIPRVRELWLFLSHPRAFPYPHRPAVANRQASRTHAHACRWTTHMKQLLRVSRMCARVFVVCDVCVCVCERKLNRWMGKGVTTGIMRLFFFRKELYIVCGKRLSGAVSCNSL